jgi:hypothetical protein
MGPALFPDWERGAWKVAESESIRNGDDQRFSLAPGEAIATNRTIDLRREVRNLAGGLPAEVGWVGHEKFSNFYSFVWGFLVIFAGLWATSRATGAKLAGFRPRMIGTDGKMIRRLQRNFGRWVGFLALAVVVAGSVGGGDAAVRADDWAKKMFVETSHDFRTVAKGAPAEYRFEFKNPYKETVRVASVKASCGCTTPSVTKNVVESQETGAIVAKFNTENNIGSKSATITVVFDKPFYSEVLLKIQGKIESDVTFTPSEINFGEIAPGEERVQEVVITHRGPEFWQIRDVLSNCKHVTVSIDKPMVTPEGTRYRMLVKTKNTFPPGAIQERLTLITTEQQFDSIDLAINGRVRSGLEVSPASLGLGTLKPGQMAEKKLVIRCESPFQVLSAKSDDPRFRFEIPQGKNKLHFVKVTFAADEATGNVSREIKIETDFGGGRTAECLATVQIDPQ